MVIKIAINGKARSGKNTVASYLSDCIGHGNVKICAFADAIKKCTSIIFPQSDPKCLWGASELRSSILPSTEKTYRDFITELGALARRYNPNVWIDVTMNDIAKDPDKKMVIISDVRFKNELEAIRQQNYTTIRIIRPKETYVYNDISEKDLDGIPDSCFDFVLVNDGSLEDLQFKIKDIYSSLVV